MRARVLLPFALVTAGIGAVVYTAANTDFEGQARTAVENQGMTDVKTEFSTVATLFKCGKGDLLGHEFTAKNPQGKHVSGYVCTGILKGSTVRW